MPFLDPQVFVQNIMGNWELWMFCSHGLPVISVLFGLLAPGSFTADPSFACHFAFNSNVLS